MSLFFPENGIVNLPSRERSGILLLNLGSPVAPDAAAVRRYLAEFLSDKRVVEKKAWQWLPLLYGIILQTRPPRSAALYRQIWLNEGAPLLQHSRKLAEKLHRQLPDTPVYVAMTYGRPSVAETVKRMKGDGITRIVCLPLFPQYAASSTGAALDALWRVLLRTRYQPAVTTINDFHTFLPLMDALAEKIRYHRRKQGKGEILLMSFHSIPLAQHQAGDPYFAQCHASAHALANALELAEKDYRITFQSRFGRKAWIGPSTQTVLHELPAQGIRSVDVVCPGFVCDCLETLEEIAVSGKEIFQAAGGGAYHYIGCLNDDAAGALADLLPPYLSPSRKGDGAVQQQGHIG